MPDPTLADVAADVAAALELGRKKDATGGWFTTDDGGYRYLYKDGSNLTDPYWRCACEDWIKQRMYYFSCDPIDIHHQIAVYDDFEPTGLKELYFVACPWPEAPARLVSAVWRKQRA